MIVIRFSKKKKIFYINAYYRKQPVNGKIIKRIGYYNPYINFKKKFFINFRILFYLILKGAKLSKRVFQILKI